MFMEDPMLKDYIIKDIMREIENEGYPIEKSNVNTFLDNFVEQYDRLPKKKEIGPIVTSYITLLKTEKQESNKIQNKGKENSHNGKMNSFIKDYLDKKDLIDINYNKRFYNPNKVLIIPKPIGRRLCPLCDNENWFKIHETIDKNDVISHFPRIYGKIYTCSGCGCVWKEK